MVAATTGSTTRAQAAVIEAKPLPIDDALPALREALGTRSSAVLEAPPGAGKTTRVPLALLNEHWLTGQRVVMLEPRRLAARTSARFMSHTLNERVGETVGYRVRNETRIGPRTRIEVVTEGVLARMISSDATLEGIGLVIFDEFHERSLHADLGLALTLETQAVLRPGLRVLVMSATLDGLSVSQLLHDAAGNPAPVIRSVGRMFPVQTEFRPRRNNERLEASVARVVREALGQHSGDVLVFLPGASEQRAVARRLEQADDVDHRTTHVRMLHGSLPMPEQDAAIHPSRQGERKIVLATSIAETSLTIEGVRVVVDCGLSRLPRYSPRTGITRLETVRVSQASANQRRGRAGRLAPGVCYRLWDEHEDGTLLPRTRPEILEADLSSLALELAESGIDDPASLRWLDTPPAGAFRQARELLRQLDALDASGRITPHGRLMASLPTHPRLAHLMLAAESQHCTQLGAEIANVVEERDVLRGNSGPPIADLRTRLELVRGASASALHSQLGNAEVDVAGVQHIREMAKELAQRMRRDRAQPAERATMNHMTEIERAGVLVAHAYPDRVAQRRPGTEPRFILRSGSGGVLPRHDPLADAPFLAVASLDGSPPDYRIALAAPLTRAELMELFSEQLERESMVEWDDTTSAVRARRRTKLGAIVLEDQPWSDPDAELIREKLLGAVVRAGIAALPWSESAKHLRERLLFLHTHDANWPDVGDGALLRSLDQWLSASLENVRSWDGLARADLASALSTFLSWEQRAALDRLAPTHLEVPSGSRIAIDYSNPALPVLAVKLQEVFGWKSTPTLLDGRVVLTLHLLSPAQRPVQVTRDLAGFWRTSYFEVRRELRGRYPRHPWPDDPMAATPTRRVKPRGA